MRLVGIVELSEGPWWWTELRADPRVRPRTSSSCRAAPVNATNAMNAYRSSSSASPGLPRQAGWRKLLRESIDVTGPHITRRES